MNDTKIKERISELKVRILDGICRYFDGKTGKELSRAVISYCLKGVGLSLYAFLLSSSQWLFGVYPLGISLIAACSDQMFFLFSGCLAATLNMSGGGSEPVYAVIYTAIVIMRFTICKWLYSDGTLFKEAVSIRSIIGLIGGFGGGVYFCITDGFTIHSLGGLVMLTALGFGLTALFSGATDKAHPLHRQAAYCLIGFCLIYAISKYSIFGFSLAFAACTVICLYSAMTREMFKATIFSLICGFACNQPTAAPMFAIMALICSVARKLGVKAAIPSGIIGGIAYAFWAYGISAITYVVPDLVCGAVILIPILYFTRKREGTSGDEVTEKEGAEYIKRQMDIATGKEVKTMSVALDRLAEKLNSLADSLKKPDESGLRKMAIEVYSDCCSKCKLVAVCSKSGAQGENGFKNIFAAEVSGALFDKGYITSADLPSGFTEICKSSGDMVYSINEEYGKMLKEIMTDDRTKAFACGYHAVSRIICEAEAKRQEEFLMDSLLSESAVGLCKELGLDCQEAYVYGKRRKQVVVRGKGSIPISGLKLKNAFSNLCGADLTGPFTEIADDAWKMTFESGYKIKAEVGFATQNCLGEDVCGDHVCCFESDDGYCYAVLSDGMGSGRQASLVSGVCCAFAESLSVCGGSLKTVVETVNGYLLTQKNECSATLDMLKIDLYTGNGCFVKSGAVSSMVIRGGHVFRISSSSVPVGVMRELNCEQISLPLKKGDMVIMTSDGVAPDFESGLFAADICNACQDMTPNDIASRIICAAEKAKKRSDDMSCIVIKII